MSLPKIFFWVFLGHVPVLTMLAFTEKRAHFPIPKKMVVSTVMEKRTFQEKVYVKKEPQKIVKKEAKAATPVAALKVAPAKTCTCKTHEK